MEMKIRCNDYPKNYISKINSWNFKRSNVVLLLVPCFLIIVLLSNPVSGSPYTEDFSEDLSQWQVWGEDWSAFEDSDEGGTIQEITSTFAIDNGQLLSTGDELHYNFANIACTDNSVGIYGNWSIEIDSPEIIQSLSISLVNNRMDLIGKTEAELNDTGIFVYLTGGNFRIERLEYNPKAAELVQAVQERVSITPNERVGWHVFRMERNFTHFNFYFDEQLIFTDSLVEYQLPQMDSFCLKANIGDGSRFDNVIFTEINEEHPQHSITDMMNTREDGQPLDGEETELGYFLLGAALLISGLSFLGFEKIVMGKNFEEYTINNDTSQSVKQIIKDIFNQNLEKYNLLIGVINEGHHPELDKTNIEALKEYKVILHPLRMAAMKEIFDYNKITTSSLREKLNLSWSEIYVTLKKLKQEGYISIKDEFHDSTVKQTIYLEAHGRMEYKSFTNLIVEFLELSDNYDKMYPKG